MRQLLSFPTWFVVLYALAMVECAAVTYYGIRFWLRYRRVQWQGTLEGQHLMRFTQVITLLFGFTLLGQVATFLGWAWPAVGLVLSNILFPWAAWEMHKRNVLFVKAQAELANLEEAADG